MRGWGRPFWVFLAISLVFALGNSSDAFLILRSKDLGLSNTETVSAYVLFNAVYSLLAWPLGAASDRLGRRHVIGAGFAVFSAVYLGFALAGTGAVAWPLFAVYGVFMAMTEGVGKALVTDLAPAETRATALGIYTGAMGAMVLASKRAGGGAVGCGRAACAVRAGSGDGGGGAHRPGHGETVHRCPRMMTDGLGR